MYFVVNVPVCDLRRTPNPHSRKYIQDFQQDSQLLFGEPVLLKELQGEWAYVEALSQKKCSNGQWTGYYGWILKSQLTSTQSLPEANLIVNKPWVKVGPYHLSFGTKLYGVKQQNSWKIQLANDLEATVNESEVSLIASAQEFSDPLRKEIMRLGCQLVGAPYLWGGRSAYDPENLAQITSLDCSALVHLLYAFAGIEIPRDAHDQFLCCKEVQFQDLKVADLIFLADLDKPHKMNHVMLYLEGDMMLESTIDPGYVRLVSGTEKLGQSLSTIQSGTRTDKYAVYTMHFSPFML